MFNTQNISKLLWLGLGLLLFAALVLPNSWTSFGQGTTPPIDIFSTEIAQLDQMLDNNEPLPDKDAQILNAHIVFVQARRLLRAGPMSSEESRLATKILRDWQSQIASQSHDSSRAALRHARNNVLKTQFPRLNPDQLALELDTVETQFMNASNKKTRAIVDL